MPQDERVSKFVAAITKEAEEKRSTIEQETKYFVESEMQKAELDALNESYAMIQKAGANIRNDAGSRISAGKIESRKNLLLRREEIIGEVLDGVRAKIGGFTSSDDYEPFLEKSVKKATGIFDDGFVVYLRKADSKFEGMIKSAADCDVEYDDTIKLGGLKFSDKDKFRFADDTFDVRIKSGREWFMKNSGITVR